VPFPLFLIEAKKFNGTGSGSSSKVRTGIASDIKAVLEITGCQELCWSDFWIIVCARPYYEQTNYHL
jgi:hypothetical protein